MQVPKEVPPGTAAALVKEKGLEAIRGVPLFNGTKTLFVSDRAIKQQLDLWADYPLSRKADMVWRSRLFGSLSQNGPFEDWIYLYDIKVAHDVAELA